MIFVVGREATLSEGKADVSKLGFDFSIQMCLVLIFLFSGLTVVGIGFGLWLSLGGLLLTSLLCFFYVMR